MDLESRLAGFPPRHRLFCVVRTHSGFFQPCYTNLPTLLDLGRDSPELYSGFSLGVNRENRYLKSAYSAVLQSRPD